MDNPDDRTEFFDPHSSGAIAPVPLPNGNEKIPLGSGRITRLLGTGGMAAVYEIWNPQLEMHRAVKIINPGSADSVHQRFQTEIKISAKLKHPNIIEIHGVGEWNGLPFIEMEKVDGVGLDAIISQRGALPEAVCTAVGIMICRALDYAHQQDCTIYGKNYHGVIHRDLKPSNIMVASGGAVKLMDFGIARPVDVSFQTMDGLVSGTLQYLAPEQIEKKNLDVRTDLYALGVTLYEIVTGTIAFPQTSFAELVTFKTKSKFTSIDAFPVRISKRLKRAIGKCMQQDPSKRVASAARLLAELEKIHARATSLTPEEVMAKLMADTTGRKVVLAKRRLFPWKTAAAVACVAAAAILGYRYGLPKVRLPAQTPSVKDARPAPAATPPAQAPAPAVNNPVAQPPAPAPAQTRQVVPTPASPAQARGRHTQTAATAARPQLRTAKPPAAEETDDAMTAMEKALAGKDYEGAMQAFQRLPDSLARSAAAQILKMHALIGLGGENRLASFLQTAKVNDGEFYLERAKLSYKNGKYHECENFAAQALSSPHVSMDYAALKREACYYTALCASVRFDANPNDQTYKNALDDWWQLRSLLRSDPRHPYNKKATDELQRMAKKMQRE